MMMHFLLSLDVLGYQFTVKDIVDPEYGLTKIIQRCDPELAVRCAAFNMLKTIVYLFAMVGGIMFLLQYVK